MHEHNDCVHELKHCKVCDVVWCVKCSREWGFRRYTTSWYKTPRWYYVSDNTSYTITTGDTHTHE